MPSPAELFSTDPFVAQLRAIANTANQMATVYIHKDEAVTLPFTNATVVAAISSSPAGLSDLQNSLNQGLVDLQTKVAALVIPNLDPKVGAEPIGEPGGLGGGVTP